MKRDFFIMTLIYIRNNRYYFSLQKLLQHCIVVVFVVDYRKEIG